MAEFLETKPLLSPSLWSRFYPKLHCSAAEDEMKGMSPKNWLSDRKKKREREGEGKRKEEPRDERLQLLGVDLYCLCEFGAAAAESAAVPQLLLKTGSGANKFS